MYTVALVQTRRSRTSLLEYLQAKCNIEVQDLAPRNMATWAYVGKSVSLPLMHDTSSHCVLYDDAKVLQDFAVVNRGMSVGMR